MHAGVSGLAFILTKFFKAETHLSIKDFEVCATCVAKAKISALCHFLRIPVDLGERAVVTWDRAGTSLSRVAGCCFVFVFVFPQVSPVFSVVSPSE